jgi:hypothetical protein
MYEVIERKRILAPRDEVWRVYTDHVSWTDWAGIGKVRLEREGQPPPNGVGCVRVISSFVVSVYEEILSFDAPTRMTYRIVRGGLPIRNHRGQVDFEADGDATNVTWRCEFESKIPGLGPLWKAIVTKVFRDTLAGLARYPFARSGGAAR